MHKEKVSSLLLLGPVNSCFPGEVITMKFPPMLKHCYGGKCNQQPIVYLHEWLTLFSFYFVKNHQKKTKWMERNLMTKVFITCLLGETNPFWIFQMWQSFSITTRSPQLKHYFPFHGWIYGRAEGGAATTFSLKLCIIFIEFRLRKLKSISNRAVLNVLATPFRIFWIRRAPVFFLNFVIRSQKKLTLHGLLP